jgi:fermentation-respiration switch protein FrsA (DUF1100 family)
VAAERGDSDFTSSGARCAAWLFRPSGDGPHPCVVMAHGFSGVREQRLDAYAERFAEAGIAALVFDYRHFGASEGEPRDLLDIRRQLEDWRAAVAHARGLEGVDPDRVAVWGTSFSGGHVVAIAAEDPRIAAVVAQAPFTTGLAAIRAGGLAAAARLTRAGLQDGARGLAKRPPLFIPAAGEPGTLAAMTSPEALPGFRGMDRPGSNWRNRFAARLMLTVGMHRPWSKFAALRMPVLVCVCDRDQTTPPEPAARAAESSPNAELRRYPIGHFEIYVEPHFEQVVSDQTEFLVRNLVGEREPAAA